MSDDAPLVGFNGSPIGCFQQWTNHRTEFTVKLRERIASFSQNDFEITTPDGQPLFNIAGKVFSLHHKKTMSDNAGNAILSISDKMFSLLRQFDIFAGGNISAEGVEPVAHVEGHLALMKTKMSVDFTNFVDNNKMQLEVLGSFWERSAEITCNGTPLARIHRKFMNMGQILFDDQTYYVTVAPGVDLALIVAIVVCLDEKSTTKK